MAHPLDSLPAEQAYYLPSRDSKLWEEWSANTDSQKNYARLCQAGHDIIANMIIEGRNKTPPQPPSMAELYQTAARVRRAIAVHNQAGKKGYALYGQPRIFPQEDYISAKAGSAYQPHFEQALQQFEQMATVIKNRKPHAFKFEYGDDYSAEIAEAWKRRIINVYKEADGNKFKVSTITLDREGDDPRIVLRHADPKDIATLLGTADRHLQAMLGPRVLPPHDFWVEMAAASRDLFHAAPLSQGTQTTNLMVLAGIAKAMGYEMPALKNIDTAFADAELVDFAHYVSSLAPAKSLWVYTNREPLSQTLDVDKDFIEAAPKKQFDGHYAAVYDPFNRGEGFDALERMKQYLFDAGVNYRRRGDQSARPFEVSSLKIDDGHISCTLEPSKLAATAINDIIPGIFDFVGHDEIVRSLGLPRTLEIHAPDKEGYSFLDSVQRAKSPDINQKG